jgi:hypothetical protein
LSAARSRKFVNGSLIIAQSIRHAQARGGAEGSAARVTHRDLSEGCVPCNITNPRGRPSHFAFLLKTVHPIFPT